MRGVLRKEEDSLNQHINQSQTSFITALQEKSRELNGIITKNTLKPI